MTCLVHNSRYRSLFHSVVNELRHENRTHPSVLRNMPHKCCTCKDIDELTLISVLMNDKENLHKLEKLINQINQDKETNPKLVLALNRLENFIKENRGPAPQVSTVDVDMPEVRRHGSFSEDDDISMDTDKPRVRQQLKPPKPLKDGTFIFLPYQFKNPPKVPSLYDLEKTLQRGRFFGRNKYIQTFEEEHHVCINMITSKTTQQIKVTLENAKAGIGNVTIHNKQDILGVDGEWILVRKKETEDQTNTADFEALLDELKARWDGFFKIEKRKKGSVDKDDEEENEDCPNKK